MPSRLVTPITDKARRQTLLSKLERSPGSLMSRTSSDRILEYPSVGGEHLIRSTISSTRAPKYGILIKIIDSAELNSTMCMCGRQGRDAFKATWGWGVGM